MANPGMRLGVSSRTKDIIEPVLKPQWWVDSKQMASEACKAVTEGKLNILPVHHKKKWFEWLENIRDWCISRQLWWGHRIPAYYVVLDGEAATVPKDEDFGRWIVKNSKAEAEAEAKSRFGDKAQVIQDEDVLDTWFSSGLFPFSTVGWPDTNAADYKAFYPNSLLETGWDILFFWVARMVMLGITLTGDVPFQQVFLHAMVRDAHGRKMSKSLGNVIDPLDVIEGITLELLQERLEKGNLDAKEVEKAKAGQKKDFPQGIPECGTDALRFALCSYTSQGRDINLNVLRVEGYRHFCNKLWNATKFVLGHLQAEPAYKASRLTDLRASLGGDLPVAERWIVSRLNKTVAAAVRGMTEYDLGSAATAIYSFFLYDFCDVYLEVCKPALSGGSKAAEAAKGVLFHCLETGLRLLHPMMPFLTEELWQRLPRLSGDAESISIAAFPAESAECDDEDAEAQVKLLLDAVSTARSMRERYAGAVRIQPLTRANKRRSLCERGAALRRKIES
jgi:valyl-tRNA synthetase